MRIAKPLVWVWIGALAGLPAAAAADGVLEINEACAAQGCFPGDVAGLPVTITSAGSYRLTSNLPASDPGLDAVLVSASDVSLDLGGFRIQGPGSCAGSPPVCTVLGAGRGVAASDLTNLRGIEVANGVVVGMASHGLELPPGSLVRDLHVSQNAGNGVATGAGSVVLDVVADLNEAAGISLSRSVLEGFVASGNFTNVEASGVVARGQSTEAFATGVGGATSSVDGLVVRGVVASSSFTGIFCGKCVVTGSAARANGFRGIQIANDTPAVLFGNTIRNSTQEGIFAPASCTLTENTVQSSGSTGIETGADCLVRGNNVSQNGVGLDLGEDSAYRENAITQNAGAAVQGPGVFEDLGGNFCTNAAGNPIVCP